MLEADPPKASQASVCRVVGGTTCVLREVHGILRAERPAQAGRSTPLATNSLPDSFRFMDALNPSGPDFSDLALPPSSPPELIPSHAEIMAGATARSPHSRCAAMNRDTRHPDEERSSRFLVGWLYSSEILTITCA
jgi:hypothetical protein